jgi:hypothetical protein
MGVAPPGDPSSQPPDSGGPDSVIATFSLSAACMDALTSIALICGTNETAALHIAVFATERQLRRKSRLRGILGGQASRP